MVWANTSKFDKDVSNGSCLTDANKNFVAFFQFTSIQSHDKPLNKLDLVISLPNK